ncbi:uncharacterized protein LOC113386116 [Ctenocephalides felis]|uniref:uncharacterized protein LOC113386116 n=1 Tax=Ctenocephalides felis TaxID=7515 RepID=UPI000E6E37EE|nr:uncharacterized protein LOC113386116 [Ctenocephalides felis]
MSKYNSIIDISSDEDITFDLKNDECKEKSKQKKLNDFFDFSPERKITVPDTDSSNSPKNNSYQDDGWEKKFMPISPENKKTSPKDELDHSILNMDFYDSANRDQTLQIISNSPNKKDIIKTEDKSLDNLRTLVHNKLGINIEGSDESDILLSKIKDIVEIYDSTRKSKAELEGNMNNLKKMYIEILEFLCIIFRQGSI